MISLRDVWNKKARAPDTIKSLCLHRRVLIFVWVPRAMSFTHHTNPE